MHHRPELFGYDADGKQIGSPVDLSGYHRDYAGLHALFSSHFVREKVAAPSLAVRIWRRLFGWAYGISHLEAAVLFLCAGAVRTTPSHARQGMHRSSPSHLERATRAVRRCFSWSATWSASATRRCATRCRTCRSACLRGRSCAAAPSSSIRWAVHFGNRQPFNSTPTDIPTSRLSAS